MSDIPRLQTLLGQIPDKSHAWKVFPSYVAFCCYYHALLAVDFNNRPIAQREGDHVRSLLPTDTFFPTKRKFLDEYKFGLFRIVPIELPEALKFIDDWGLCDEIEDRVKLALASEAQDYNCGN